MHRSRALALTAALMLAACGGGKAPQPAASPAASIEPETTTGPSATPEPTLSASAEPLPETTPQPSAEPFGSPEPSPKPNASTTPAPAFTPVDVGAVTKDRLLGRAAWSSITTVRGATGQREAVTQLWRMLDAAKADLGFGVSIVSSLRDFNYQRDNIWNQKWRGKKAITGVKSSDLPALRNEPAKLAAKILDYSAMPGASRHHWGTDFDIGSVELSYWRTANGKKLHTWLTANAKSYGFCQVYSPKTGGRKGYNQEDWHWSYMPLASKFLSQYGAEIGVDDIATKGGAAAFDGASSEVITQLGVIPDYVLGIAPDCLAMTGPPSR